jgi:hypothetical protein
LSRIRIVGLKSGFNEILERRLETNLRKVVNRNIRRAGLIVEGEAKQSIQRGTKSGKLYKRRSVVHQASAPGEAPASDTGFLASNISTKGPSKQLQNIEIDIISKAPYSKFLEFGTRNILQPALEKNKRKIKQIFRSTSYIKPPSSISLEGKE